MRVLSAGTHQSENFRRPSVTCRSVQDLLCGGVHSLQPAHSTGRRLVVVFVSFSVAGGTGVSDRCHIDSDPAGQRPDQRHALRSYPIVTAVEPHAQWSRKAQPQARPGAPAGQPRQEGARAVIRTANAQESSKLSPATTPHPPLAPPGLMTFAKVNESSDSPPRRN
jgi:hypothetical protein